MNRVAVCVGDAQLFLFLRHILAMADFEAVLATHGEDIAALPGADVIAVLAEESAAAGEVATALASMTDTSRRPTVVLMKRHMPSSSEVQEIDHDFLMPRPFDPEALLEFLVACRQRAVLRADTAGATLKFADLEMNLRAMTVTRAGRPIHLSALQFRLLRRLMEEPTMVRDREDLISACWSRHVEVEPRTVDIHIGHLRRALHVEGPDLLRTVRGHGYALQAASETDDQTPAP